MGNIAYFLDYRELSTRLIEPPSTIHDLMNLGHDVVAFESHGSFRQQHGAMQQVDAVVMANAMRDIESGWLIHRLETDQDYQGRFIGIPKIVYSYVHFAPEQSGAASGVKSVIKELGGRLNTALAQLDVDSALLIMSALDTVQSLRTDVTTKRTGRNAADENATGTVVGVHINPSFENKMGKVLTELGIQQSRGNPRRAVIHRHNQPCLRLHRG